MNDIRVGGYLSIGKGILDDSVVDAAMYIEEILAKVIGYALDNGILMVLAIMKQYLGQ